MNANLKPPRLVTFGCRLNAFESEAMRRHALAAGLEGAVIVNTCAVTAEAQRQARQAIRKARREHPDAPLVVTGCAAQTDAQAFAAMEEADAILGNTEKMQPESWSRLAGALRHGERPVMVSDIMAERRLSPAAVPGMSERTRAFVQVQSGCDHRCTFCIIPFGRGNARSLPAEDVVAQVRAAREAGHREVVLTGVDLTSWGADLGGEERLGHLLARILREVPRLERLRVSSIDVAEIDEEFMALLAGEGRLMPHLHLSLQAGDDMILKRMKRRHCRAEAVDFCARARDLRPDVALGADLIAGFPTETEEMFENSLHLLEDCGLVWLHVFPFSPRPGTPAAAMPQVDKAIIRRRASALRAAGQAHLEGFLAALAGQVLPVLVERPGLARAGNNAQVIVDESLPPGEIVPVHITGAQAGKLIGERA